MKRSTWWPIGLATVLLATVLFLVAIAQRFKFRAVRTAAGVIALVLLIYAVSGIVTLPRI